MRIAKLLLTAGLLVACSSKKTQERALPAPAQTAQAVTRPDAGVSEFSGVVRGVVKLAPDATLPLALPVLSHGVKPPSIAPCPDVDENDQRVVSQSKETGGLSPMHVALTGMQTAAPTEQQTHEVFIDACRMRPTLVGARKGDLIKLTNRSEMALVPQIPGESFMRGLLRGDSHIFEARQTQTKLQCSFGSYCGGSLVVATTHSLYDVTTEQGFFEIKNVPLDQPLTVHAWHPLFRENSVKVELSKEKPEAMVEILLTPAPPKAPEEEPKERDDFVRRAPDGGLIDSKSRVVIRRPPVPPQ